MNDWIGVKDRLPEDFPENSRRKAIPCIVALTPNAPRKKPNIVKRQRQWDRLNKKWEWSQHSRVIYWMPLPEPPKEAQDNE